MGTSVRPGQRWPTRASRLRGPGVAVVALLLVACEAAPTPTPTPTVTTPPAGSPSPGGAAASATPAGTSGAAWIAAGALTTPRVAPNLVVLGDGRVLAVGNDEGCVGSFEGALGDSTAAELWDPATATWSATASLNTPRARAVTVTLPDGRALVAAGANEARWDKHADTLGFQSYSSAWVFDHATARWERTGLLGSARTDAAFAVLSDGRVLVAGGYFADYFRAEDFPWLVGGWTRPDPPVARTDGGIVTAAWPLRGELADVSPPNAPATVFATAELYDPATGTWSRTGPLAAPRYATPAVTLADGRVLVAGQDAPDVRGYEVWSERESRAEVYDPARGRFAVTGPYPDRPEGPAVPAWSAELVALGDGGALLVGGYDGDMPTATTLRYDPTSNAWSETGRLGTARANPTAVSLADGRVLVAGGEDSYGPTASAEVYDPATASWSPAPSMPEPRIGGVGIVLADSSVLIAGGWAAHSHQWGDQLCPSAIADVNRFVPAH